MSDFETRKACISVCICTYNRADSLRRTLTSLRQQVGIDWAAYEILVVDNNCTDHTQSVTDAFADILPVRRVCESTQGLAYARNRAIAAGQGEVILFTDDDIIFDGSWLAAFQRAITVFPNAGYFGGRIIPSWQGRPPAWYRGEPLELLSGLLGWYDLGLEMRQMSHSEPLPFGANFAVRRSLARQLGGFRTDLGVRGSKGGRGEETEFLLRARRIGVDGVYVGNALCHHAIAAGPRLRLDALFRYGIECGKAHAIIHGIHQSGSHVTAALHVVRGLNQLLKGRGDRFRQSIINAGIQHGLLQAKRVVARLGH
jgi:glycosyltransferase involved in cell wall biosynthesis